MKERKTTFNVDILGVTLREKLMSTMTFPKKNQDVGEVNDVGDTLFQSERR